MRRLTSGLITGLLVLAALKLSRWVFNLAGQPTSNVPEPDDSEQFAKTILDFNAEFASVAVPEITLYGVKRAFGSQLSGKIGLARQQYADLRAAPWIDGATIDLTEASSTIKHNLCLLNQK
jgi:hypothetical protein